MPSFFLPHCDDPEQAERNFAGIARFIEREVPARRIWRVHFRHNRRDFVAEVGVPMDAYFEERGPVLAIFGPEPYAVCTPFRGGARGDPIFVGMPSQVEYFDD